MEPDEYYLYCIVNYEAVKASGGNRGKMYAMAGHAFLHSFWDAELNFSESAYRYRNQGMAKKICLRVDTEEQLHALQEVYYSKCGTSLVTDAAITVFEKPTVTCLGIGPILKSNVGNDLQSLKVFI